MKKSVLATLAMLIAQSAMASDLVIMKFDGKNKRQQNSQPKVGNGEPQLRDCAHHHIAALAPPGGREQSPREGKRS